MVNIPHDEPVFQISVVARMIGVHQQTLRSYERLGFVIPARSNGNQRMYSPRDVEVLQRLRQYVEDLGVNLAGAEVLMRLSRQVEQLQDDLDTAMGEIERLRVRLREARGGGEPER